MLLPMSQGVKRNNGSVLQHSLQWSDDSFGALDRQVKPHSILPLFDGGDFDAEYNKKYNPVEFKTPPGIEKALLEAVVTGMLHKGSATSQWASVISNYVQPMAADHVLNWFCMFICITATVHLVYARRVHILTDNSSTGAFWGLSCLETAVLCCSICLPCIK